MEVFRLLDTQRPVEQVIDVPKISQNNIQQRFVDRDFRHPQVEEQLVEVPLVVVARFRLLEPIADIPALRGPCGTTGTQDTVILCLPSRLLTIQFCVVVVIMEVFKVFTQDRVCSALLSRSFTFQVPVVAFTILSVILFSQLHPQFRVMSWSKGFFFALFTDFKKLRSPPEVRVRGCTGT